MSIKLVSCVTQVLTECRLMNVMGDGEALAILLLKDPDLLFAAQSGKGSLGPGAEFMEP